jgi:predicted nucleic acid-binding protein
VIYFDSTYLGRLYVQEHGSGQVSQLAVERRGVTCCVIGQVEIASIFHRKFRENAISPDEYAELAAQLADDIERDVWRWLPVSQDLFDQARQAFALLASTVYPRAADALHLVCAREAGFSEIHTNDRHMLAAAPHFGLRGVNVIPPATS